MNIDNHFSLISCSVDEAPVILWWTPFGNEGKFRECGNYRCYFTSNRTFQHHQKISVTL